MKKSILILIFVNNRRIGFEKECSLKNLFHHFQIKINKSISENEKMLRPLKKIYETSAVSLRYVEI